MSFTFLEQFKPSVREGLIEYCNHLTNLDVDIIMLMARKAACFYHCLETLKLVKNSARITTDRVIGMDLKWMENKRVAIVDELVITGTTLGGTKMYLERNVKGITVTCHVLAVNKNHWQPTLVLPDNKYLQLDDASCTELGADIVRAMSILPRPYSIDYPLYMPASLRGEDIRVLAAAPGWESHDITSKIQLRHNIRVITITPLQNRIHSLSHILGINLHYGNLPKLRIYGRYQYSSERHHSFIFRVLPFYIFKPLYESDLEKLFANIGSRLRIDRDISKLFTSGESKLRLLQYIIAHKIALTWLEDVNSMIPASQPISLSVDERELSFLFPPTVLKTIKDILLNIPPLGVDEVANIRFTTGMMPSSCQSLKPTAIESFYDAQYVLAQPFYEMFVEKEQTLRTKIEAEGVETLDKEENKHLLERLQQGITIKELIEYFHNIINTIEDSPLGATSFDNKAIVQLVSLFLDVAVDTGIAVPITSKFEAFDGPVITRSLRHGEEVRVSNRELYLMSMFLNAYKTYSGNSVVPKTFLEKLLVLFIQGGFNSQILEGYVGRLNDASIVSVRHYAFGAISQLGSKGLRYEFDSAVSLSKLLVQLNVLTELDESEGHSGYTIEDVPEGLKSVYTSSASNITNAESTSRAFGQLLASGFRSKPTVKDINDITYLASCLGPIPAVLSLAAEVKVFLDWWDGNLRHLLGDLTLGIHQRANYVRTMKALFPYNALISGAEKYSAIQMKWPEKILEKLKLDYCVEDLAREVVWNRFWTNQNVANDNNTQVQLDAILHQLGQWIEHMVCMLEIMSFSCAVQSKNFSDSTVYSTGVTSFSKKLQRKSRRTKRIVDLWSDYQSVGASGYGEIDKAALKIVHEMNDEASHLLDSVKNIAGKYGELPTIDIFDSVLKFFTEVPGAQIPRVRAYMSTINYVISKSIRASRNPALKTPTTYEKGRSEDIKSYDNDRWISDLHPVVFRDNRIEFSLIASGKHSIEWLTYIADKIIKALGSELKMRFLLYGDLKKDLKPFSRSIWEKTFVDRFWQIEPKILEHLGPHVSTEIITLSNQTTPGREIVAASTYLERLWKMKLQADEQTLIKSGDFNEYEFILSRYRVGTIMQVKKKKVVDLAILTILPEERGAVKNVMRNGRDIPESELSFSDLCYEGTIRGRAGRGFSTVLIQSPDPGNADIIITASHLLQDYSPKLLILLGIAGSIDDKVNIGDVVIADEIFYYEKGKEISHTTTLNRITSFRQSRWVKNQINRMFATNDASSKMHMTGFSNDEFKVQRAPIGSGDKVLAAKDGKVRAMLKYTHDKTSAVEMEAAGIAMIHESSMGSKEYSVKDTIIIRGISDKADVDKNDDDHIRASVNAVFALMKLLESMDDSIFRNSNDEQDS